MIQRNLEPKELFRCLEDLRIRSYSEAQFWPEFLELVSQLLKTQSIALFFYDRTSMSWSQAEIPEGISRIQDPGLIEAGMNLVQKSLDHDFATERVRESAGPARKALFAIELHSRPENSEMIPVLLCDLGERVNSGAMQETIVRANLIRDIPSSTGRGTSSAQDSHLENNLEIVSNVLSKDRFTLACLEYVNLLATHFQCSKVSLGWSKGDYVEPIAISHMERFDRKTDATMNLEDVFEESLDQDEEIQIPNDDPGSTITKAHEHYKSRYGLKELLTLPMRREEEPIAVLTLEKIEGKFTDRDLLALRLIANQLTPALFRLYEADMNPLKKLSYKIKKGFQFFLGVEKTWTKLGILAASLVLLFLLFGNWMYKVEALATMVTDRKVYISAPFDGMVHEVHVRPGDSVKEGQVLLELDTQEILLRRTEARSELVRFQREGDKARAQNLFADMRISEAKVEQAEAKLERIEYLLSHAKVKAPIDGIIIEGEQEKLIGAPLSKGDLIYQIARSEDLYLTMKVEERDIDWIYPGQSGELALLSQPDKSIPVEVTQILPVAQVDSELGNVFQIHAKFNIEQADWYRPGMSGVAKLRVGERPIWWILTHRITAFFQLYFWL